MLEKEHDMYSLTTIIIGISERDLCNDVIINNACMSHIRLFVVEIMPIFITLATLCVTIWGIKRIMKEFELRAIDSLGGFYTNLNTNLQILDEMLGTKDNCLIADVYCFDSKNNLSAPVMERHMRFQEQIASTLELLKTANGQLPLSKNTIEYRYALLKQLLEAQSWLYTQFTPEDCEDTRENFKKQIAKVYDEVGERFPVLLHGFWKQIDKKLSKRIFCKKYRIKILAIKNSIVRRR